MDKWSAGLPQDAFDRILSLYSMRDNVRMGSVCKSWLSVSKWSRRRGPELPWLMMVSNPNSKSAEEEEGRCFFSLSEKTFYSINIPEIRGWRCCGSFNSGWLMTIHQNLHIRLFHPWRKIQLPLPHYYTIYPIHFKRRHTSDFLNVAIRKAAMSDDAAVILIIYDEGRLAFCRTREDKVWTRILDFGIFYHDIIYHKGKFSVVCYYGEVGVLHINKSSYNSSSYVEAVTTAEIIRPIHTRALPQLDCIDSRTYLVVDSPTETLFTVVRIIRAYFHAETSPPHHYIYKTLGFKVYELGLDETTGEYKKKTVEVESLGDRVMFLGLNSSTLIMSSQFPGFKGNCIYFTDDFLRLCHLNKLTDGCTDMGVFNMEDKTICPLLLNRAHPYFSPPIWITSIQ